MLIGGCCHKDSGLLQSQQSETRVPAAGWVHSSHLIGQPARLDDVTNTLCFRLLPLPVCSKRPPPVPVCSETPPLSVLRKFLHLLDLGDADIREEAELLRLREEVVRGIRFNRELEADLDLMDLKIGLLVRNRATLQVRTLIQTSTVLLTLTQSERWSCPPKVVLTAGVCV